MEKLKCRLLEVVEENNMLHAELKRSVVDDIARTASVPLTSAVTPVVSMLTPPASVPTQSVLSQFSVQKWQTELVVPFCLDCVNFLAVADSQYRKVLSFCH